MSGPLRSTLNAILLVTLASFAPGCGSDSSGSPDAGGDARDGAQPETGAPDVPADTGRDGGTDSGDEVDGGGEADSGGEPDAGNAPDPLLDECFAGLPAPEGMQSVATKRSSDGRVWLRIALDTEDRMGTSGTYGWGLIRLGVQVDGVVTCITDRSQLVYTGSHHNCADTATATAGTTRYELTAPDRAASQISIFNGTTQTLPATVLLDTACTMRSAATTFPACRSGGPCA